MKKTTTLLPKALDILVHRQEEKERQYGPIDRCLERTARIATELCQKDLSSKDVAKILVALKLSRESNAHKSDNLLDAICYLDTLNTLYE